MCAAERARVLAEAAIETGEAVLLRILPDGSVGDGDGDDQEVSSEEGAVTIENTCLSGGDVVSSSRCSQRLGAS